MTATRSLSRARHIEHCMGTVFTLDVRGGAELDRDAAIGECVSWLHDIDRVFSTYRAGSDVSRLAARTASLGELDPRLAEVLQLCADVSAETEGYFTARWSGGVDPTGLVKGWAVEQASRRLRDRGLPRHCLNGGGDIQLAADRDDAPWRVAITDPHNRARVLAVVMARDGAVATSGSYERGAHILDPFTGRAATEVVSATVVGPSLTRADAYATAAVAMGAAGADWLATRPGYDGLLVLADARQLATPGWPRWARDGAG